MYEEPHNLSSSFDFNREEGDISSSSLDRALQFNELMGSLLHLDRQFSDISMLTKKANLNENQIQVALSWGLEKIFNIRCPEMLEKRKNMYTSLDSFFKIYREGKIIKPKVYASSDIKSQQNEEESENPASNLREKPESEEPHREEPKEEEPNREKPEREQPKREPRKREQQKQSPKKKDLARSEPLREEIPLPKSSPLGQKPIKMGAFQHEESTQASFSDSRSNPYVYGVNNQDEYEQKINTCFKKEKNLDDMTYHIEWQKKGNFKMEENTRKITKLFNDDYRKICGLHPFQDGILYKIKFKVIKLGTIAIGLVKAKDKAGLFIDDRYTDCLKFITFFNGDGGKFNLNGTNLRSGKDLGMSPGEEFEMIFDTKKMHFIMKTTRMRTSIDVSLECYRGQVLYPYLEMKQEHTEIQFL